MPLSSGTTKPSSPAPAQRPPQPPAASPEPIEEQVDALLDQAQQQVKTMAELTNAEEPKSDGPESASAAPLQAGTASPQPESAASSSEPAATAPTSPVPVEGSSDPTEPQPDSATEASAEVSDESSPPQPVASADAPVDPAALQSQVDAILAEAGYPVGEAMVNAQVPPEDEAPEDAARPSSGAEVENEPARDEAPTRVDLSEVDAVIADAAERAMEEEDFDSSAAEPSEATGPAALPAAGAKAGPAGAAAPARPKAVKKGGDASMRREKRKRKPPDVDLDGDFTSTAPLTATPDDRADDSAEESNEDLTFEPVASVESPPEGWIEMIRRHAMTTLSLANSPWHTWSVVTRCAVLAVTIGNGLLALIAFVVVLRRMW